MGGRIIKLSVIVPAYNEEQVIGDTIEKMEAFLQQRYPNFELIIGNDGSKDKTEEIVNQKKEKYPNLKLVSNNPNQGKGSILTKCFLSAEGEIQLFIDADLPIEINELDLFIQEIKNGADLVIANKYHSKSNYSLTRKILGNIYRWTTQEMFHSKINDFQTGIKAFRKDAIKELIQGIISSGWTWDTEILIKAEKRFKIKEIPVDIINQKESKMSLSGPVKMFLALIKLKRELKRLKIS